MSKIDTYVLELMEANDTESIYELGAIRNGQFMREDVPVQVVREWELGHYTTEELHAELHRRGWTEGVLLYPERDGWCD